MFNSTKSFYKAPSMSKIGDFETTTLSSTGSNKVDAVFTAAVGDGTHIITIIISGDPAGGLIS